MGCDPPMTALIYVDTSKKVGDRDHLKVFSSADAAATWFAEKDLEGVAFEVIDPPARTGRSIGMTPTVNLP